jgi:hypothetical protein
MMGTEDGIDLELPSTSTEWVLFNVDQIGWVHIIDYFRPISSIKLTNCVISLCRLLSRQLRRNQLETDYPAVASRSPCRIDSESISVDRRQFEHRAHGFASVFRRSPIEQLPPGRKRFRSVVFRFDGLQLFG